jgi:hypothetical protein
MSRGLIDGLLLLVVLFAVFGTPFVAAGVFWIYWRSRQARLRRLILPVSSVVFIVWAGLIGSYLVKIGAWQSGILAQGSSPDGREYVVVQTFTGYVEPYRVTLYMRDAGGVWRWNYLAHDDAAWGRTVVEFSPTEIFVRREGVLIRKIPLSYAANHSPPDREDTRSLPANFSAEDVADFHHQRFG